MNPFSLIGKTILVTGASSGLGRQTAITASQMGAKVVITGRDTNRLQETFNLLNRDLDNDGHIQIIANLESETEINTLAASLPELNGVVFSTGISDLSPARFITSETISKTFRISFDASVLLMAGLLAKKRVVKNNCSIVFISSISTSYPFVGGAMYISAKAALVAYSRVLALELAPKKIRVNCVSPAFVRSPMLDQTAANYSQQAVDMIEAKQLMGLGDPEDVANAIVFYLSDASKWISATNIILGGG